MYAIVKKTRALATATGLLAITLLTSACGHHTVTHHYVVHHRVTVHHHHR